MADAMELRECRVLIPETLLDKFRHILYETYTDYGVRIIVRLGNGYYVTVMSGYSDASQEVESWVSLDGDKSHILELPPAKSGEEARNRFFSLFCDSRTLVDEAAIPTTLWDDPLVVDFEWQGSQYHMEFIPSSDVEELSIGYESPEGVFSVEDASDYVYDTGGSGESDW